MIMKSRKEIIDEYLLEKNCRFELNTGDYILDKYIKTFSIITIVSRPSIGKTTYKDQLCTKLVEYGWVWLDFQLEMTPYEIIRRELIRAGEDENSYLSQTASLPIYTVNEASAEDVYLESKRLRSQYSSEPMVVSIDHCLAVRGTENGKRLHDLMMSVVRVKRELFALVILISQLNREVMKSDRITEGTFENMIFESDIYMSDILYQYSDILIAIDNPFKRRIRNYTHLNLKCDINDYYFYILKNRFSPENNMLHYKMENLTFKFVKEINMLGGELRDE